MFVSCFSAAPTFHRLSSSFFSLFIISFFICFTSIFRTSWAYQCTEYNSQCPGICCKFLDPYLLLTPTCHIQVFWFASKNGTVWPFPNFRFEWGSNKSIMGTPESKPEVKTTEVLTMHPSWDSHANEENNSGVFFSLLNVHFSCVFSTIIFCFCLAISILIGYLGYRRFCARPKSTSRPAAASRSSGPLRSRFSTVEDKIEMEDFDEMTSYGYNAYQGPPQPNYASAPQPNYASAPRYARKSRYGPQQQTRFGGNFADPVEQLRLLLQAAPVANAPPALAYQLPAAVHVPAAGPPPPAQQPLNLGAAAANP
jgi:hypothetical protein